MSIIILEVNGVGTVIMEWHGGFGGEIVVQCPRSYAWRFWTVKVDVLYNGRKCLSAVIRTIILNFL